jgi:butyryl-CoA dehydrogenase
VFFENCFVPEDAVVGEVGGASRSPWPRSTAGASASRRRRSASRAPRSTAATAYSKERKSFGVTIAQHQAIQFMLADMATELDAARLLTWRAATHEGQGRRATLGERRGEALRERGGHAHRAQGLQIHGGYGYSTEFPVERHYRDARITEIYEGTSEIQRIVIAANLLKA